MRNRNAPRNEAELLEWSVANQRDPSAVTQQFVDGDENVETRNRGSAAASGQDTTTDAAAPASPRQFTSEEANEILGSMFPDPLTEMRQLARLIAAPETGDETRAQALEAMEEVLADINLARDVDKVGALAPIMQNATRARSVATLPAPSTPTATATAAAAGVGDASGATAPEQQRQERGEAVARRDNVRAAALWCIATAMQDHNDLKEVVAAKYDGVRVIVDALRYGVECGVRAAEPAGDDSAAVVRAKATLAASSYVRHYAPAARETWERVDPHAATLLRRVDDPSARVRRRAIFLLENCDGNECGWLAELAARNNAVLCALWHRLEAAVAAGADDGVAELESLTGALAAIERHRHGGGGGGGGGGNTVENGDDNAPRTDAASARAPLWLETASTLSHMSSALPDETRQRLAELRDLVRRRVGGDTRRHNIG